MKWPTAKFGDVLADVSGGNRKVPKGELLSEGALAVVDQGKALVAGYTDKVDIACKAALPVIVFGDHTRAIKFIDFDFAMGADGTKVLSPVGGNDARYLYYALSSISIPSAGYSRHFKFLKAARIPLPPLPEQKRIARILDAADALREKRRESIAQLDALVQSTFLEMFGDPVTNPMGWEIVSLKEIVASERPITYGILKPGPDMADGVPYVRVVDIRDGTVLVDQLRRTTLEIAQQYKRSKLTEGDLLMSIRGHVGRMALVPQGAVGANITQDTARFAIAGADSRFVMFCIAADGLQQFMRQRTKGAAVQGINLGDLKSMPIPRPPPSLQLRFAAIAESAEQQRLRLLGQLSDLNTLFASLQSRAFAGEL